MKTSIATVSVPGELREKLSAIADAGFDGVEIFEQDFLAFDGGPKEVGRIIKDHGLEITLFQPFRDFEGLPEPERTKAFDRAERKFDLMNELGTDLVLICSSLHPKALGGIDRAADDFSELGERAAKKSIRVGYEALAWGKHVWDHRDAWEIVRRANHPNIGLILDSFHTLGRGIDSESIRSVPADKIFFLQLADAPLIEMDLFYWSRHFRNMPGEGDLDLLSFMKAVMATGYSGPLSLEIFNDQFRGGSPKLVAQDGYRSLVNLMDQVNRSSPDLKLALPSIPAPATSKGIEFVEFTTDEAEAEVLGSLLNQMGFINSHKHVSKSVDLWTQNDIKIVINTEKEGFAHSAYVTHGTSVCDVGLAVENAEEAWKRATALGADPFSQTVGPNELTIPAIRGVGGSLLHFVDERSELSKVWEREFLLIEDATKAATDAKLKRVDHIAQTMNYDEMLSWTLFYTSIFDATKTPLVDVVDPGGLVRSQAVEGKNSLLRITLNGAESHRTFAGQHLASSFGSAVQHLAFESSDIFGTARAMKNKGFEALEISPNYYLDLAARFDLTEDILSEMQALNIMYDKDEQGEFFQLYSKTYGEGFFFEIIQRKKGYQGYGGPNAPFRVAAQKRAGRAKGMPRT